MRQEPLKGATEAVRGRKNLDPHLPSLVEDCWIDLARP